MEKISYFLITYTYEHRGQMKFDDDIRSTDQKHGKSIVAWLIRQRKEYPDKAFIIFETEISKAEFKRFEDFKINEKS